MTAIPTIHLNGTDGRELLLEYTAALNAAEVALTKLQDCTCHGRDFYAPNPESTFYQAREERGEALDKLRGVISYLETVAVGLDRQLRDRAPGYHALYTEG